MKKNIKTILGYIAGGATVLSYQALYENIQSKKSGILAKEQLNRMEAYLSNIEQKVNGATITPEMKVKALSHYNNPDVTPEKEQLDIFKEYWPIFENKFNQIKEYSLELDQILKIEDG